MAKQERKLPPLPNSGPFLAEVVNHLDSTAMGGLEVAIIKGIPSDVDDSSYLYPVSYLNPFYGATSIRHEGNNSANFNDVQKSYGMWFVPPDPGSKVLVIFVDGDPNQGYWIGSVMDTFQNHMIPGIAASKYTAMTADQQRKYGTTYLPVAEFHKKSQSLNQGNNVDKIPKAVHPFADVLLQQGLLLDVVRGVTSSNARRETPSQVFGISTPGPKDTKTGAKTGTIGNRQAYVSRLGGSSFVMDDGDVTGQNELIRIRTRTGHQILLHNSADLIYIANSQGSCWIELTSSGKLDIYAADSVSIHSEADMNFRADRDINLEAARNINMVADKGFQFETQQNFNLVIEQNLQLQAGGLLTLKTNDSLNIQTANQFNVQTAADININSSGNVNQTAQKNFNFLTTSGNIAQTANVISANGIAAAKAQTTALSSLTTLTRIALPNKKFGTWSGGNFYAADPIGTFLGRIPTHEPYDQHENLDPVRFNSTGTDIQASGGPKSQLSA